MLLFADFQNILDIRTGKCGKKPKIESRILQNSFKFVLMFVPIIYSKNILCTSDKFYVYYKDVLQYNYSTPYQSLSFIVEFLSFRSSDQSFRKAWNNMARLLEIQYRSMQCFTTIICRRAKICKWGTNSLSYIHHFRYPICSFL